MCIISGKTMWSAHIFWLTSVMIMFMAGQSVSVQAEEPFVLTATLDNPQWGYPPGDLGQSLCLDGDQLIVGAPNSRFEGELLAGMAVIFNRLESGEWERVAEFGQENPAPWLYYGTSVGLDGAVAMVGVPKDDATGSDAGCVYAYRLSDGVWQKQQTLYASGATYFGQALVVQDNLAVAGAPYSEPGGFICCYEYLDGVWEEQQLITNPSAATLGEALAISGDTLIVGDSNEENALGGWGSASVFVRSGGAWVLQQKINALPLFRAWGFGASVALEGDTAVVGGQSDDVVYVYKRSGAVWTLQQELSPPTPSIERQVFGRTLALSSGTLAIASGGTVNIDGAVHTFIESEGTWTYEQTLPIPASPHDKDLGESLALAGDYLLCGVPSDEVVGIPYDADSGSVYTYNREGGTWNIGPKIAIKEFAMHDKYGSSVAMFGDTLAIGTEADDDIGNDTGSVYMYQNLSGKWQQTQKLLANDARNKDNFGGTLALSSDTLLVGCIDHYAVDERGKAYALGFSSGTWTQEAQLVASDGTAAAGLFGCAVACDQDTALVGAQSAEPLGVPGAGAAYVFTRSEGMWSEQQQLTASDAQRDDMFGIAVTVGGNHAVVGASGQDEAGSGAGAAYVFVRSGDTWSKHQKLLGDNAGDNFGRSVLLSGTNLFIGAPYMDTGGSEPVDNHGAVYWYQFIEGVFVRQQVLVSEPLIEHNGMGYSLAVWNDIMVAGADDKSSAYQASKRTGIFRFQGGQWNFLQNLESPLPGEHPYFGNSVAVSEGMVAVGEWDADSPEDTAGTVLIYAPPLPAPVQAGVRSWRLFR